MGGVGWSEASEVRAPESRGWLAEKPGLFPRESMFRLAGADAET